MDALLSPFRILLIFLFTAIIGTMALLMRLFGMKPERIIYLTLNRWWGPLVLRITGTRVRLYGKEYLPEDVSCIYVANHASFLDIPVIGAHIPSPLFFVAKKSLARVPFLGWYMHAVGMILIDRGNREKAMASMRLAALKIKEGKNVLSFPEGTRSKDGNIAMFRRGSFVMAREKSIPVVPVALKGVGDRLKAGSWILHPGEVTMCIGPVLEPANYSSAEEFAAAAKARVEKLLQ